MRESEKKILNDMKSSQYQMDLNRGSVRIDGKDILIKDLDMNKLNASKQKDQEELQNLENRLQNLTWLSMENVDDVHGNFSMRPTLLSDNSQNRALHNLQYEIEKYQNEIKLLKLKLQFKHQLIAYKNQEKQRDLKQVTNY